MKKLFAFIGKERKLLNQVFLINLKDLKPRNIRFMRSIQTKNFHLQNRA
jgi:hypothetical protein